MARDPETTSPRKTSPNTRGNSRSLPEGGHSTQSIGTAVSPLSLERASLLQQNELQAGPARKSRLLTALVVAAWFVSNIVLLLSNKYLLSNYGFRQPVFLTLCHMLACVVLSTAFSATNAVPRQSIQSSKQLIKISVLAIVFAMSVVLGNISLRFIPVSFSQAVGATTPAFTAALSFLMVNARESERTYAALLPVVIGIVIATGAEPSFNLAGFAAAVTATAARAFKSVLQGILLTDAAEKMDSMNLLRYMAPISLGVLVPATVFLEPTVFEIVSASRADVFFIAFLSLNAALAYFVNLLNFLVTKHTSALTLQVLGNGKGVAAVVVSVMVFRNPVTFASVIGYLITVSGVMLYMFAKRSSAAKNLPDEKGAGDIAV
ncbi:hypothetical protein ABBQ32_006124 [Trebouxia sp. C0010 RCD-2024]